MPDINKIARVICPQEIESNDGRFNVKCCDEGMLRLRTTMLDADHKWHMNKEEKIGFKKLSLTLMT